jgi:hypothetical protein
LIAACVNNKTQAFRIPSVNQSVCGNLPDLSDRSLFGGGLMIGGVKKTAVMTAVFV